METGYEDPKVLSPLRRPEGQLEMIDERGLLGEVDVFRLPTPMILLVVRLVHPDTDYFVLPAV